MAGAKENESPTMVSVSATYASPVSDPFTATQKLPALASSSTTDKTKYLNTLRKATATVQGQINKELTTRMEEDKARDTAAKSTIHKLQPVVDEAKEEEYYGEEVAEDED
jgi:hypothetical protein